MISIHFQGKPFNITVIQVYVPTGNAEKAKVKWFYKLQACRAQTEPYAHLMHTYKLF